MSDPHPTFAHVRRSSRSRGDIVLPAFSSGMTPYQRLEHIVVNRNFRTSRDCEDDVDCGCEDARVTNNVFPFSSGTFFASVVSTSSSILGSGTLALPFAFKSSGLLMTHLIILGTFISNLTSSILLLHCCDKINREDYIANSTSKTEKSDWHNSLRTSTESAESPASAAMVSARLDDSGNNHPGGSTTRIRPVSSGVSRPTISSYEQLVYSVLGSWGYFLFAGTLLLSGTFLMVANLIFASDCLKNAFFGPAPCNVNHSIPAIVFVGLFVIFPICCPRNINTYRYSSLISIGTSTFLVALVAAQFVKAYLAGSLAKLDVAEIRGMPKHSDCLATIAILVNAFGCQLQCIPICSNMKYDRRTTKPLKQMVVAGAMAYACLMYEIVGVAGYLTFGHQVQTNVLNAFSRFRCGDDASNPWTLINDRVANAAVGISVAFSTPLVLWPVRSIVLSLLRLLQDMWFDRDIFTANQHSAQTSATAFWVVTLCINAAGVTIGVIQPSVTSAFKIIGGIGGSLLCFTLPGVIYLAQSWSRRRRFTITKQLREAATRDYGHSYSTAEPECLNGVEDSIDDPRCIKNKDLLLLPHSSKRPGISGGEAIRIICACVLIVAGVLLGTMTVKGKFR